MARDFNLQIPKTKILSTKGNKYIRGLNTLVSATQIREDELSEAVDIQLIEDGKIKFPRDGQTYYGLENGTKVTGIFPFYKSDGTQQLLRMSGIYLQKYNTTSHNWDNISGATYTTDKDTEAVMAYDRLYICNGYDNLTYYDGTSITTFTAVTAPVSPTCTRTGTTGTYTFSYKITSVTAVGESMPTAAVSDVCNVATLDTSTYMTIAWTAKANAIGYNLYGRKDGKWFFMTYLDGNGTVSYVDKGTLTPDDSIVPPEGNSTQGPKGKHVAVYKDSLFIYGDPTNPSRLYYSGGGDKINDFSAGSGGGFVDITKNDGQIGTGMAIFKNSLIAFKQRAIYQFSFGTTGAPQYSSVTNAIGCNSPRSIVLVENDVFFSSYNGVYTIGNESGFAIDVLRTNELSAKVRSIFQSMEPSRRANVSAVYAKTSNLNLVIFAYTPAGGTYNSKALVYDRERLAWYEWTNIQANCWTQYTESTGEYKVLYGDDNSGYVKEILTGSDDFGSAIRASVKLRGESFGTLTQYKKLKDLSVVLRQPTGTVNLSVVVDGTTTAYTANAGTVTPSINWGHYLMSAFLLGESYGTGSVTSSDDLVLRTKKNIGVLGKSFMLTMDNGSSGSQFILLENQFTAKPRSERWRFSSDLI